MSLEKLHEVCLILESETTNLKPWAIERILELEISEYPVYIEAPNKQVSAEFLTEEERLEASEFLKYRFFS